MPDKAVIDEDFHHELSPSSAHRWMACFASVGLSRGIPEGPPHPAAVEGTLAHKVAEEFLLGEREDFGEYPLLHRYTDYVLEQPGDLLIEKRVSYSDYVEGASGSADAIRLTEDSIHVIDLKYGMGRVHAPDNPQGILYLLGALQDYGFLGHFTEFTFSIVQPRLDWIDSATYTLKEVEAFGKRAKFAADVIYGDKPVKANPGVKQCQWCPAKGICPAQYEAVIAIAQQEFKDA